MKDAEPVIEILNDNKIDGSGYLWLRGILNNSKNTLGATPR